MPKPTRLGAYERFIDENLSQNSNVTSGRVYWNVIQKERNGDYGGGTVQVIPHITNEIKSRIAAGKENVDIALVKSAVRWGTLKANRFWKPFASLLRNTAGRIACFCM